MIAWVQKHNKLATSIALVLVITLAAASTAIHLVKERATPSEDGVELNNKRVDPETVSYYKGVCDSLNDLTQSSDDFIALAERSVGLDAKDAAALYRNGLSETAKSLSTVESRLNEINDDAPVITRADGEDVYYSNATMPLVNRVSKGQKDLIDEASRKEYESHDSQAVGRAANESLRLVSEITGDTMQAMSETAEKAPIFSDATAAAVEGTPECASLFGASYKGDKDDVVHSVVNLRLAGINANDDMTRAMDSFNNIVDARGASPKKLHELSLNAVDKVNKAARDAERAFSEWENSEDEDSPQWFAADRVSDYADEGEALFKGIVKWSDKFRDELRKADKNNADAVSRVIERQNKGMRDTQVNSAKFATKMATQFKMPNPGTSDEVNKLIENTRKQAVSNKDGVDQNVVTRYKALASGRAGVVNGANELGERIKGIESMPAGEARRVLSGALIDYADEVYKSSRALDDLHLTREGAPKDVANKGSEVSQSLSDFARWLRARGEMLRNVSDNHVGAQSKTTLDALPGKRDAVADMIADGFANMVPYVNDETARAVGNARQSSIDELP